ncbi:MAG: CaiB/BaiF CoA-transferase family protein [Novosphingobium sp.]|nr:CaiB/BaiF CoA-transferase family protein [Novosphingobium sp.]
MGPLEGIRVVEMAGIGPAPFCAMLLADMGAKVIRVDRLSPSGLGVDFAPEHDLLNRGKRSVAVDLKLPEGVTTVRKLIGQADVLIEGFRLGVMEKLGLGPNSFEAENPQLVFGRMTGWGQSGPLAAAAGHDINYIAITGVLHSIGRADAPPTVPLNLVGDFGGGSLYLALGILAAVIEARQSGRGQVVDSAIVDGVANLLTFAHGMQQAGQMTLERGRNLIDSGAPFYDVYETRDARYVAVGAVEPKFFLTLCEGMGLSPAHLPPQYEQARWPELREIFATRFREKTSAEWCALLEGTDACFAPVLDMIEAAAHPHNVA